MSKSLLDEPVTNRRFQTAGSRSIHGRSKYNDPPPRYHTEDSLLNFQEEIDHLVQKRNQLPTPKLKKPNKTKSKTTKVVNSIKEQTVGLKKQISQLKGLLEPKNELRNVQSKLEVILKELQIKKRQQSSYPPQQHYSHLQQPVLMPPPHYYPPPYYPSQRKQKYRKKYEQTESESEEEFEESRPRKKKSTLPSLYKTKKQRGYNRREQVRRRLRKIFFAVTFIFFMKGETKKLSVYRKNQLRKFYLESFENQINNIKNWLLNSQKYSLSIIIEKGSLDFNFFQKGISKKIRQQKEYLIMQLVQIGIKKIHENSTSQKLSSFTEILNNLCRRGSFALSRFWTAYEMEQICVSQFYGFFRIDPSLEKVLITILIFIKVFIFNMFLQPHKFDSTHFPKYKEPLSTNMMIISSVYYHLVKQVIQEYIQQPRDKKIYKQGNWLNIPKQFIVECSEPLIFGEEYPEDKELISGLLSEDQVKPLKSIEFWSESREKLKSVIEKVHEEMMLKMKLMRKNLKYKVYN